MAFQYLKDYSYYNDLYDLHTIKSCLNTYWTLHDGMIKKGNELKDMDNEEFNRELNKTLNYFLYFKKGERYVNKKKTIDEWIAKDKVLQDKLDNATEPQNVICPKCKIVMKSTMKELENYTNEPLQVFFFFECPKCKKRKSVYENGEEKVYKTPTCSKCGKKAKMTYKKEGKIITWTTMCLTCGYKEVDVDDFDKSHEKFENEQAKDKALLEKYRAEMCFDDKKGKEYIEFVEASAVAKVVHDEEMHKYDDPAVEQALKLKKTKIADIETRLIKETTKAKFVKFTFDKPEINQYVIVPFTVEDVDSSRDNRQSVVQLEKLIKNLLADTNWRLLTGSIIYRMGYLQGRLKGYEQEEDLINLFERKKEIEPVSKITDEMKQKYVGNNLVQLARMSGQHDGIENMRKRMLTKEPDGFFLKEEEGIYTCSICRQNRPGREIWWTPDSLRCADCWENVKNKIIPPLTWDHDHIIWFDNSDLQYSWSLHSSTIRKLQKQDVLKGRDLKTKDGSTYYIVYLVKENQEFINKYPKKQKIEIKSFDSKGNKIYI